MSDQDNWFVAFPVVWGRWYDLLVERAPEGLVRLQPGDLHATIAFLGRCGQARAEAAWATLDGHTASTIDAELDGLVPLGGRRPTALSLTFARGRERLANEIGVLRGPMFVAAGARPDSREPLPHVTLFRFSRGAGAALRRAALEWAADTPGVRQLLRLDRLALYTRAEGDSERRFRIVSERRLEQPPSHRDGEARR